MYGYFSVNLSSTCWVSSCRVSEPHHEKRISTGSGGPDDVGASAGSSEPPDARRRR